VMEQFFEWWNGVLGQRPELFSRKPEVEFPMRWLPGSSIPADEPLIQEFSRAAGLLSPQPPVEGMDAPSDMYIFQNCFHTPALMWGPSGDNAHMADEFVDLDSLFAATRVLLRFVSNWCGLDLERA
jgi:acetylornithine deacetylase